jgi:hypothetical protein
MGYLDRFWGRPGECIAITVYSQFDAPCRGESGRNHPRRRPDAAIAPGCRATARWCSGCFCLEKLSCGRCAAELLPE